MVAMRLLPHSSRPPQGHLPLSTSARRDWSDPHSVEVSAFVSAFLPKQSLAQDAAEEIDFF